MTRDDARVREHFDALRRRDAAGTPAFAAVVPSRAAGARRWSRRPWLLAASAAGLALLLLLGRGAPPPRSAELAIGPWRTPTDVLLETPGSELLRSPRWDALEPPAPGAKRGNG